ncbi:MAG TPA: arginine deiminase family protein [Candidatus Woesebacteria bacterium]|nr:arginine deiminase family protein [Candidatus Woesebacteria bacterium]
MQKLLLCPPTYFDIAYAINPWMHIDKKVSRIKVLEEYTNLKNKYTELGVEFDELQPTQGLPDQVYTTDMGLPVGKLFIKSNFKYGQRKPEATIGAEYFTSLGYAVYNIPPSLSFEGEGDLIKNGDRYFMGWGQRTMYEAEEYLSIALQKQVIPLKLIHPSFFHLDTCFAPLNTDVAMYYPKAFSTDSKQTLSKYFKKLIAIEQLDADVFACNLIILENNIVIHGELSYSLKKEIEKYGFIIHTVDMSEYLKGGGSVKCVSLQIFE